MQLTDIKRLRKRLNMTQSTLASEAGVSQSLIAKIESGRVDPTYTNAQRIFETLNVMLHRKSAKAADIMCPKVISCSPNDSVKEVIALMRKEEISQVPVLRNQHVMGLITETSILAKAFDDKEHTVKDVMEDAPPLVSTLTGQEVIFTLLKYYPIVLVKDSEKICGVIAKSDMLKAVR
ncbi:MAG: CBS domain-containing protein [Nanoarchaeota archaeon]